MMSIKQRFRQISVLAVIVLAVLRNRPVAAADADVARNDLCKMSTGPASARSGDALVTDVARPKNAAAPLRAEDDLAPFFLPSQPPQGPTEILSADPVVLYLNTTPARPATTPDSTTASQRNNSQLNQLLQFEVTPDICAEGEGYLSAEYEHLNYDILHQNRFALQGQYGVTDQVAVGASLPFLYNTGGNFGITTHGIGDVVLFGQYKCDKLIDPKLFSLTAHVSVVLPTGDHTQLLERGQFGVRPLALAYKDFGTVGPGQLGAYGLLGFTISGDADIRWGLAGTYKLGDLIDILELSGEDGSNYYGNIGTFTPGVTYRGFEHFELTVGIPLGLTNDAASWGATAKLTYAFQS